MKIKITLDKFKAIIAQDDVSAYVYGVPARFMFDDAADELDIYYIKDDEDYVETVKISENKLLTVSRNEVTLVHSEIMEGVRTSLDIVLFQEVPFIVS